MVLPLCWWLALHTDYGVWGVVIGIAVASFVAGVGQVLALELIVLELLLLHALLQVELVEPALVGRAQVRPPRGEGLLEVQV